MELCGMVDPDCRRQGISRALLAAACTEYRRRGSQRLLIICEEPSIPGRAFVATTVASLAFSEYRMTLHRVSTWFNRLAELRVEQGQLTDVEAIAHITAQAFGDSEELVLARIAQDLPDPSQRFYVARLNGLPVASLEVYFSVATRRTSTLLASFPCIGARAWGGRC
jgi:predicted N-acetyltransferase YhbS